MHVHLLGWHRLAQLGHSVPLQSLRQAFAKLSPSSGQHRRLALMQLCPLVPSQALLDREGLPEELWQLDPPLMALLVSPPVLQLRCLFSDGSAFSRGDIQMCYFACGSADKKRIVTTFWTKADPIQDVQGTVLSD